jgi:glycosyltransferase involved in cell wall biosynthesis
MGFRKPIAGPMAAMDATIVSAENEPFGRTLIEAQHLGVPVIATRSGGNLEAIVDGENGLLVDLGNYAAMARAAVRLTHDPELRRKIVANAAFDLEARYGADRHVAAMCQIYDSLCPDQDAGRPGGT